MTRRAPRVLAALIVGACAVSFAQDRPEGGGSAGPEMPPEKLAALATANQDELVIVEYTLQYDKGEAPETGTSPYDVTDYPMHFSGFSRAEDVIREERPLEMQGILVDATHVVTPDLRIHPRFIKAINVRRFDPNGRGPDAAAQRVSAAISAYPTQHNALILEMGGSLSGAKPATFDAKRSGPYLLLRMDRENGRWGMSIDGLGGGTGGVNVVGGKATVTLPRGLVIDKQGVPVGFATAGDVPADGSWKGSPLQWPATTAAAMKDLLSNVERQAQNGIVSVTLNFRSPKGNAQRDRMSFGERDSSSQVQNVLGVALDEHTLLVLADLKPSMTARLERIKVLTGVADSGGTNGTAAGAGGGIDAKFKASLMDYAGFIAQTDKPLSGAPALSTADILDLRGTLLPTGDIYLQGEKRAAYFLPGRIEGFTVGWRGNIYPQVESQERPPFLFDAQGNLLAVPLAQREKVSVEARYRSGDDRLTPVAHLVKALSDLKASSDPNNVPLTEEQENRLAWIGVELQGMSQELARANNVADQTRDGETGALVTYVYADSPAASAGVQPGWVMLRVDVEGQPKPIDVRIESDPFSDEAFPWDRLGDAPESVFDRIPTPWPSAENPLIRTLTDLGFGKKYVIEFAHEGKVDKKDFTVIQGPANYDSAPKYKLAPLGLTVRDLTYEVRRYMQKKPDDPGVIISKIDLGSKASVSGLKPYEVITHVNDQAVMNVKDFERLARDQTDLRLSVKRMNSGRIVKITLPAPGGAEGATQGK